MRTLDPENINGRLYKQVAALLTQLEAGEHITIKERIAALVAIGRIQTIFVGLRKEKNADESAGSTVRKYATAFKNDAGRGKKRARGGSRAREVESDGTADDWFERAGVLADGDDDDNA
jgi:hypothetical protein